MNEYVLVQVGRETYALPVIAVRRIAELGELVPIAGAAPEIIGVSAVFGELIPILDVGRMLGAASAGEADRLVIAQERDRVAGLAVNAVVGVQQIVDASEDVSSPHLAGAALLDGALVGIVDVRSLFDSLDAQSEDGEVVR